MNYTNLVTDARFRVGADTNNWSAADLTRSLNNWYHKLADVWMRAQGGNMFDDPNLGNTNNFGKTFNLTANTQNVDLSWLTNNILKIERVEVSYDGTNWKKAEPIMLGEMSVPQNQTDINAQFSTGEPFYLINGSNIYLYPIPTASVTGGLKLWFRRELDEFTTGDTTQEPAFSPAYHDYLSIGAAYDYAISRGLPVAQAFRQELALMEQKIAKEAGTQNADAHTALHAAAVNYE